METIIRAIHRGPAWRRSAPFRAAQLRPALTVLLLAALAQPAGVAASHAAAQGPAVAAQAAGSRLGRGNDGGGRPLPLVPAPSPLRVDRALGDAVFFGGIQVNEPDHDRWAAALVDAGLDTVEVTLYARQQRWDEAELWWPPEAPWVVSEIRAAKRAGLRVVLVMRVALEQGLPENRHLWHGMIWPRSELLDRWFRHYSDFVLWGAHLAAREHVDLFAVGNELSSLTSTRPVAELPDLYAYYLDPHRVASVRQALVGCADSVLRAGHGADLVQLDGGRYDTLEQMLEAEEQAHARWARRVLEGDGRDLDPLNRRRRRYEQFWRELIVRVRSVYSGPLTYGANFDQYDEVGFWDALDVLGVNAYFPLGRYRLDARARRAQLRDSWLRVARKLEAVAPQLPVVLLELGWTRWRGSTVRPYSYSRVEVLETGDPHRPLSCVHWATQPEEPAERVAAMQALDDVVEAGQFPTLRGFILWKLTTRKQHRAIEPFAVLLQPGARYASDGWERLPQDDIDGLDVAYLALATRIASRVRHAVATEP